MSNSAEIRKLASEREEHEHEAAWHEMKVYELEDKIKSMNPSPYMIEKYGLYFCK